jgi:hypothetical protein
MCVLLFVFIHLWLFGARLLACLVVACSLVTLPVENVFVVFALLTCLCFALSLALVCCVFVPARC